MEYKVIDVDEPFGGYDPVSSFRDVNPFTTAFCRTRDNGNVLLVGGLNRVKHHLAQTGPTLAVIRMWHKGKNRGYTRLFNCNEFEVRREGKDGWSRGRRGLALYGQGHERIHWYRRVPATFPRLLEKLLEST